MQTGRFVLGGAVLLLAALAPARAGVYLPDDPRSYPLPTSSEIYYRQLVDLQKVRARDRGEEMILGQLGNLTAPCVQPWSAAMYPYRTDREVEERSTSVAGKMRTELARLEILDRDRKLSLDERIKLGGYYALMYHPRALGFLHSTLELVPNNFMVLANLATVYLNREEFDLARRYQSQVLDGWPRLYPGWSGKRLRWHRRVEQLTLKLIELRQAAKANPQKQVEGRFGRAGIALDDLFPGVKFIVPGRPFRPGEMDSRMREKLPPDALELVEQLLFSMPHDIPLQALLAELFNANGDIRETALLFVKLDPTKFEGQIINPFTIAVNEAARFAREFTPEMRDELMFSLGMPGSVLAQDVARVALALRRDEAFPSLPNTPVGATEPKARAAESTESTDSTSWLPDWRTLATGFVAGLIVGVLLLLQFRQGRRPTVPRRAT
jgi:hypothetical protein